MEEELDLSQLDEEELRERLRKIRSERTKIKKGSKKKKAPTQKKKKERGEKVDDGKEWIDI